jgi:hypothetical protein
MWVLLLGYAAFLCHYVGAVSGGSDTSGYYNEARLFSHFAIHTTARSVPGLPANEAPPYFYVPLGFKPVADGSATLVPTYPPGLALMLVPVAWVVGWHDAGSVLLVLHSMMGLVLTYRLGRQLRLARPWALAGAAALAASPLYLYMSLWAMSDIPAMVWATAAVILAWRSRERPSLALAAGACAAVGFLLRPSNFLIVLPMLVVIGWSPRRLLLAALAGIPGPLAWLAINRAAYGQSFQSGYGDIAGEFHGSMALGTLRYCMNWLPLVLSPIVLAAPAIVAFLASRTRVALALLVWAVAYIAFYAPYRWTHEAWWFLRFLLPAAPALLVAGLIVVQEASLYLRGRIPEVVRVGLFALLIASCLAVSALQAKPLDALTIGRGEQKYRRIADWLRTRIPDNSVVVASQFSGSALYYTPYILVRADQVNPEVAPRLRAAVAAARLPVYAVTFPFEADNMKRLPGKWILFGTVDDITVWKGDWDPTAR